MWGASVLDAFLFVTNEVEFDSDFQVWYKQILDLTEKLGIVEEIYSQEDTHTEKSLKHSQL